MQTFKLERWFARFEFSSQYLLCCSDCETFSVNDLIQFNADPSVALKGLLSQELSYTESQGNPILREEICKLYNNPHQPLGKDNILVTAGAEESIFLFFHAILKKGDSVVVHYPCYQSLTEVASSLGCNVIEWTTSPENGWELDIKFLKKQLAEHNAVGQVNGRIQAIVINCPHNPTGYALRPNKLKKLAKVAKRYDVYLFSDEVYRFLDWNREFPKTVNSSPLENDGIQKGGDDEYIPAACEIYEKAISLGVMSKSFGLAGLRIGWIATQATDVLRKVATLKDYTTICSAGPSEYLSILALKNKEKLLERNRKIAQDNMALLDQFFEEYKDVIEWTRPKAGPAGFPRLKVSSLRPKQQPQPLHLVSESEGEGKSEMEAFCEQMVSESGVLLLPGGCFGRGEFGEHFRLGFGRKNLPVVLQKFKEYLDTLRE